MNAPSVSYTFNLKDVHMFYHEGDNSMNFASHDDDGRIEIYGINAENMFQCIGNALCCGMSILDEIKGTPWQLDRAQEMINKLQVFIDNNNNND